MAKIKVQITVEEDLLQRVESYADEHFTTRSGVFNLGAEQLLLQDEARKSLNALTDALQRIAASNKISEEDKRQIDSFSYLAATLNGRV